MKDFFNYAGKTVKKIYVNQFGSIIFSLMMVLATIKISSKAVMILSSLVSVAFFFYLIYLVAWEKGASDRIKVDGGRMSSSENKGGLIGAAVVMPVIILCIIWFISSLLATFAHISFFAGVNNVISIIVFILQAMFSQALNLIGTGMPKVVLPVLYLLSTSFTVFAVWISYRFGYNGKFMPSAYKGESKK